MSEVKPISAAHPKFVEAFNRFIVPAIQKLPKPEPADKKEKGA